MRHILLFMFMLASGTAFAGSGMPDKPGQLESALNDVRQEQQSVYQNYQMTKDLRLMEVQQGSVTAPQHPYGSSLYTPPPNYDDVVRAQLEREQRIQQYTDELKRLAVRYLELEDRRKALLERIDESKLPQYNY